MWHVYKNKKKKKKDLLIRKAIYILFLFDTVNVM